LDFGVEIKKIGIKFAVRCWIYNFLKKQNNMRVIKLFLVGVISASMFGVSCTSSADCSQCTNLPQPTEVDNKVRGEQSKLFKSELASSLKEELATLRLVAKVKNMPQNLKDLEPLLIKKENKELVATSAKEDALLVNSIFNTLLAAENKAGLLKVELSMSEEPVDGGYFLFAIASENERLLELQMFDEKDLTMVANNQISLTKGNNYKALNMKGFAAGDYMLKIKDVNSGEEIVRKLSILPENL
jgi:hypothetical protein